MKRAASKIAKLKEMEKLMPELKDWRRKMKGLLKPRRKQPLREFATDEYVRPEGWDKKDSVLIGDEVVPKFTFVPGYVKAINLHVMTYLVDGTKVTPNVFNKKCLATEELIAMVLYMHFVQNVTIGKIYKQLNLYGLNISEATLDNWIALGIDEFKPLMEATQKEIVGSGEGYIDGSHMLVRCNIREEEEHKRELKKAGKADDAEEPSSREVKAEGKSVDADMIEREHYLGKWVHNIISPKVKLTQYLYRNGDRGAYVSAEYLIMAVEYYLHCDGAKMYKCYEPGGRYEDMGITRVGCGSHVRRPFWKLRLDDEDARWITEQIDMVFCKEAEYKAEGLSDEERKRRRGIEISPILYEIKEKLDKLHKEKSSPDAWKHPGQYQAVDYALTEWFGILNYLECPGEFDNNVCERQMRFIATLRNNSLFWGSHTSAERLATILTVVESCKLNKLNAYDYMVDMLKHLRSHTGDLAQVLANKWKPTTQVLTMYAPVLAQK